MDGFSFSAADVFHGIFYTSWKFSIFISAVSRMTGRSAAAAAAVVVAAAAAVVAAAVVTAAATENKNQDNDAAAAVVVTEEIHTFASFRLHYILLRRRHCVPFFVDNERKLSS